MIDDERVDDTEGSSGQFTLRGTIPEQNGKSATVIVKIHAGVFQHKYVLDIDGTEYPMTKLTS